MTSFQELMGILSIPRPNGSAALRRTAAELKEWCRQRGISFSVHQFRIYPYFFEAIGVWLIASHIFLSYAIWSKWGWLTFLIAVVALSVVLLNYVFHIPLITWPGAETGENILIEFVPGGTTDPGKESIISAHYDSKSEPLDHQQRLFLLKAFPIGILMSILAGISGPLVIIFESVNPSLSRFIYVTGMLITIPMLFLVLVLGLNLASGRLSPQSCGAVDNGAACAIILRFAEYLTEDQLPTTALQTSQANQTDFLQNTRLTLAIFTGEEVDRQGSRAYARSRDYPPETAALNLEVMGQNGPYVLWQQDGSIFHLTPTDPHISDMISRSVAEVTGTEPVSGGPILSDGAAFIERGIPTAVLGTYDIDWKDRGFHKPTDNLDRVVFNRLPEGVGILKAVIQQYDQSGVE
ncbi:MAG: M28 family peptidase [Chloroflexi bacterium]|nr:MAG: M28 family peptidase [Chloroflexota bacterium]